MEKKKITANDTIISMLANINADKLDLFYKSAEDYVETLSKTGDISYRIKRLINQKPLKLIQLANLPNEIKKLITPQQVSNEAVYLNSDTSKLIDELLVEWENKDVYKFHNLPIRNKILLHGATGNGKTTIAKHIAKLSNLPFVEINSDIMIDSKIGSTNQNIHRVLNEIKEPCVLFWDEVDTIGRARGRGNDSAAGLENERMVNSILVNIEKLSNDVIFIGATNRKDVLDTAFLRRFDIKFELYPPVSIEKKAFAEQMIEYYKLPKEYILEIDYVNCVSYSDIKMRLTDYARKYVLNKFKP